MGRKITQKQTLQVLHALREKFRHRPANHAYGRVPRRNRKRFSSLLKFVADFKLTSGRFHTGMKKDGSQQALSKSSGEVKEERYHAIMKLQASISRKKNRARIGQEIAVLIEGASSSKLMPCRAGQSFRRPKLTELFILKRGKRLLAQWQQHA